MAQSTPYLQNFVHQKGVTYKSVTAATHVVAQFQTETDMGYHIVFDVVCIANDNYDETNSYRLIGTFQNDGGTLTQVGSTTTDHSAEGHAGITPSLGVSGTVVQVKMATDDTSPIIFRTVASTVVPIGDKAPHQFGDGANNNPS